MFLADLFREIIFRPLFNILIGLYDYLPGQDFGIAIIALTILVRLALIPLSLKGTRMQAAMQRMQPEVQQIRNKYKAEREKQARALMELYKKHRINPLSGFLPILIQLPIIIAVYRVLLIVLDPASLDLLYNFIPRPGTINPVFLGMIDLSKQSLALALATGLVQFAHSRLMLSAQGPQKSLHEQLAQKKGPLGAKDVTKVMGRQMTYIMPPLTVIIAATLPAGIAVYWFSTTLFSVGEFWFVQKKHLEKMRREREAQSQNPAAQESGG